MFCKTTYLSPGEGHEAGQTGLAVGLKQSLSCSFSSLLNWIFPLFLQHWCESPALPSLGGCWWSPIQKGPNPQPLNPDHDQPHGIISPGINRLQTISGCTSILEMPPRCLPNYCNLQSCLSICPSILLLPAPLNPSFCPVQSLRGNGTSVIQNSG